MMMCRTLYPAFGTLVVMALGALAPCAAEPSKVPGTSVSQARGYDQFTVLSWTRPSFQVKQYKLYLFKDKSSWDRSLRQYVVDLEDALEVHQVPRDRTSCWDRRNAGEHGIHYKYVALIAVDSNGRARQITRKEHKLKGRSERKAPSGSFSLIKEFDAFNKRIRTVYFRDIQNMERYFTWDKPRFQPKEYVIHFYKYVNGGRRAKAHVKKADEEHRFGGSATSLVDNRKYLNKPYEYEHATLIAVDRAGKGHAVSNLKSFHEGQGARPKDAHPLFKVERTPEAKLAPRALAELTGQLGQFTVSDDGRSVTAKHPLDYWQQAELIDRVYKPAFEKHRKGMTAALVARWGRQAGRLVNPKGVYKRALVRALFVKALASDHRTITAEQRDRALLKCAREVGPDESPTLCYTRKRGRSFKVRSRPDTYVRVWERDGGRRRGFYYPIQSHGYRPKAALSVRHSEYALFVLALVPEDSPIRTEVDALRARIADDAHLARARRFVKGTSDVLARSPKAIAELEKVTEGAHNRAQVAALLAKVRGELTAARTAAAEKKARHEQAVRARAEREAAFVAKLSPDQKKVFKSWGRPFEITPRRGGRVTWTIRYKAHHPTRRRNGSMMVIGWEFLTYYFSASGEHVKHTKRREYFEGSATPERVVWQKPDGGDDEDWTPAPVSASSGSGSSSTGTTGGQSTSSSPGDRPASGPLRIAGLVLLFAALIAGFLFSVWLMIRVV